MFNFPGEVITYFSIDEVQTKGDLPVLPEILNSFKTSSIPDHNLKVKKDSIFMLMRNLNVREGLCNGTRLQVIDPGKNVLRCIIVTGDRVGDEVFIPRITLIEDKKFPYELHRHQFPIKPAFCLTINKSQGQTFEKIGIDFTSSSFSHGQTYVALSRVRSWDGMKVRVSEENKEKKIKNIVWKEAL